MQLVTSRKTLDVTWAEGPTLIGGNLLVSLYDARPLSQIAADFEGQESLSVLDGKNQRTHEGYAVLSAISRDAADGSVLVTLSKP